jgi:hypothetical protein
MQERMPSTPMSETPPPIVADDGRDGPDPGADPLTDSRALTILTTEHWSLLSTRSLAWNETFSRAGMYLATLSAATVALALVASVLRDGFLVFALVILPVVLFVGLATVVRLSQSMADDGFAVQGMNRIRHAYLEMVPGLEPYFTTSQYDDVTGVMITVGAPPSVAGQVGGMSPAAMIGSILHGFVTTLGMIMVLNSVIAGIIAALVAGALGAGTPVSVVTGFAAFLLLAALQTVWGLNEFRRNSTRLTVRFPTPPFED